MHKTSTDMHTYTVRHTVAKIIALATVCQILLGCGGGEKIDRVNLKIIFTNKPTTLFKNDNKLSADGIALLKGLHIENPCKDTVILDPSLIRADIENSDTSIAYPSEKSFAARVTMNREFKLLEEHLQKTLLPASLTGRTTPKSDSLFRSYVLSNSDLSADSLVIYSTNKRVDSLELNSRKYKAFSDFGLIRKQIETILCSNPKATIALLIDPPSTAMSSQLTISEIRQDCQSGALTVKTMGGDSSPIVYSVAGVIGGQSSNKLVIPATMRNSKSVTIVAIQNGQRINKQFTTSCTSTSSQEVVEQTSTIARHTVVSRAWTRVAGSNFCVGNCVLAYTERDNLGNTRERRINNYADCCPASN